MKTNRQIIAELNEKLIEHALVKYFQPTIGPKPLHVIVSLSSGASSAVAAQRAIDKYGRGRVELVFADTLWEDDDNYRFLDDLERHFAMPITRLISGLTPLDDADNEHIIPNQKLAKCSNHLKVDVIKAYVQDWQANGYAVVMVIGYDWKDAQPRGDKPLGRLPGPRKAWGAIGVDVAYPLLDTPVCMDSNAVVKSWGIKPPRMYQQGYRHANCGGRCVKQGRGDWRRTLINYPARFAEVEAWERKTRATQALHKVLQIALLGRAGVTGVYGMWKLASYSFLRDVRDGITYNLTLEALRLETEQADERQFRMFPLDDDLAGDACGVVCGVGDSE